VERPAHRPGPHDRPGVQGRLDVGAHTARGTQPDGP
jgi:hypothetical protein